MYKANRIAVAGVLFVALMPLSSFALIAFDERDAKEESLNKAVTSAANTYRSGMQIQSSQRRNQEALKRNETDLQKLAKEKRELRLQIASIQRAMSKLKDVHGIDVEDTDAAKKFVQREQEDLEAFIRYLYVNNLFLVAVDPGESGAFLQQIFQSSLADTIEQKQRNRALAEARMQLFRMATDAEQLPTYLAAIRTQHEVLAGEYLEKLDDTETTQRYVQLNEEQLVEIKHTVADVHSQVLRMQSELARIDARLQRQTERNLIEKGLLSLEPGSRSDGEVKKTNVAFTWPVYGPVSAGFYNKAYKEHFGVPHLGMDIVVPQGSPVHSSADGVVFLAKDGGATGYSYVLIGHRSGYATLYGHLSEISVHAGQDVSVGQVIGSSGGKPGTYGAGLMTTGSHLHFEVIQAGTNINPMDVLL